MKVAGSSIEQLDKTRPNGKPKPKSECRKWRLWATTEEGRKSKRFEGSYTQAQDALRAWVSDLEGMVPNAETFGSYAESWRLWREKSGSFAKTTVREDRRKVDALRRTSLDSMRMDSITPEDCRNALMWLKSNPARCSEYTNTSMSKFHQTLMAIMDQAVGDGKLASNPMANVKPPKLDTDEREALSPEEIALFLNRLDGMQLDGRVMALYLMACLGLRRGEACALFDSDIAGGLCAVSKSVSDVDGEVGPTKTSAGVRVLPVPPRLQSKVDEWRVLKRRLGFSSDTLCCNLYGNVLRPSTLGQWWRDVSPELGCDGMTLHQLRHSNLSMMARHMSPFDLQRYAGWATIAPAMTYVHDDVDSVRRAVDGAWSAIGA